MVKLGILKKTGQKVAIKIMSRSDMSGLDLEMLKTEIEILKVCQHPNIIKFYDIFENVDLIYISKKFILLLKKYSNGVLLRRRFVRLHAKAQF